MQQCDYHLFLQAMKGINTLFTSFFEANNKIPIFTEHKTAFLLIVVILPHNERHS